jgi:hypothetical protein
MESAAALGYVIEVGSRAGSSDLLSLPLGAQTQFIADAPPGRYFVRLRVRNSAGLSAPSPDLVIDVQ